MDPKKLALPDQVLSPRRKVVSGLVLWIGASLIILSLLLFSNSFKGRVVAPLLQGFNTVSVNSSFVSWRFSFPTTHLPSSVTSNDTGAKETYSSEDLIAKAPDADASQVQVLVKKFHLGNSTENVKNRSMTVDEGTVLEQTQEAKGGNISDPSGNGSVLDGTHLGNFSDTVKNVNLPGEEGILIRNFSLTGDGCKDANISTAGKSLTNSSTENNTVVKYSDKGNLLHKEVGIYPGGEEENQNASFETCNIFDGRWVKDDSKPYYPAGSCPHIDRDFNCYLNGRPDDGFVKWKWQPNECNIPSLNATDFLERLRGQKLVFVGDSLNRNMWESLVCILRHSIRNKKRVYEISGRREFKKKGFYAFRFEDYNCTVDFVGSPFLVRESSFNNKNGTFETLRLDLMDHATKMYQDADIIVFNTGHWWTHEKTSRGEDYYQEGNYVHPRLKVLEAYRRALLTWARWVDKNIDSNQTLVFFRGYSVTHFRGITMGACSCFLARISVYFMRTQRGNFFSYSLPMSYVMEKNVSHVFDVVTEVDSGIQEGSVTKKQSQYLMQLT
ncbi:protein trichome birefringence-like 2 isoform X2 [Hevea brasiliensis]|uniref:protein trichome birefringence-like 2 isoform X2 n=1 Tax=Hevea brasiliensis TaxID=3981 RepID=UPI0025DB688F|nr:protein trichome birefringence-like 2 isoform X2 [Hevea brasiliensis]